MTYWLKGGIRGGACGGVRVGRPFDVTTKELLGRNPRAWLELAGWAVDGPVRPRNVDLSTVSAEADLVFEVGDPASWLAHVETQSGRDSTLPERLARYNILLVYDQGLDVRSLAVLLRPEADGPELSGTYRRGQLGEPGFLLFTYAVLRVWELPLEAILRGDLALLPLAPLTDVAEADMPEVVRRMEERIRAEAEPELAGVLWTSTVILTGLKFRRDFADRLFRRVRNMKESTTYQAIVEEGVEIGEKRGQLSEARRLVLRMGRKKGLGEPAAEVVARLEGISNRETLEQIAERVLDAASWADVVGERADG